MQITQTSIPPVNVTNPETHGGAAFAQRAPPGGTVRLGPWRIAQAALYHGRAVKIVGVVTVTTGPLS
jgi:hypothetical protein